MIHIIEKKISINKELRSKIEWACTFSNCKPKIKTRKQNYLWMLFHQLEKAKNEYNNKQTRNYRKIKDYFQKVCESQNDIAREIIIELGDMDFWNDKDENYKIVSDALYKAGIFTDDENEIANNLMRKVKSKDDIENGLIKRKNDIKLKG